jgi:hypothetical protein
VGVLPVFGNTLLELAIARATWLFTTPRAADGRPTRLLRRALRYLALGSAGISIVHWPPLGNTDWQSLSEVFRIPLALTSTLLEVLGMLYVGARLQQLELRRSARRARATALALCAVTPFWALGAPQSRVGILLGALVLVGVAAWVLAFRYTLRLRRALRVVTQRWWLDTNALPRARWVSCAKLADGRVEVLFPQGKTEWFLNAGEARQWLLDEGFVPAKRALEKRLVRRLPSAPGAT